MFMDKGGSRLVHDKLDEIRIQRDKWIEKSRQGGIKSGQIRKKLKESENQSNHPTNHRSKGGSKMVDDCFEPKGNTSTSSSISHSLTGAIPSKQEVLAYADQIGLAPWKAEDWWLDMETKGWHMGTTEVRNWQAGLTRIRQFWETDGRPMQRPSRNGATATQEASSMPLWKRIEVLTQDLQTHPGNAESTFFRQGDAKAREDYKAQKTKLKDLRNEERKAAMG